MAKGKPNLIFFFSPPTFHFFFFFFFFFFQEIESITHQKERKTLLNALTTASEREKKWWCLKKIKCEHWMLKDFYAVSLIRSIVIRGWQDEKCRRLIIILSFAFNTLLCYLNVTKVLNKFIESFHSWAEK
jgi:hypothetical protein